MSSKVLELDALAAELDRLRAAGKRIVHCHGVFDLLHVGHIRYFEHARKLGDVLVVTLTPDRFVNKGPGRPAFSESLRAEALAALGVVDLVAINKWPTAVETLKLLRPHFYAKGPDYKDASKDRTGGIRLEEEAVKAAGGQLVITDDITFSSSKLINRHMPVLPESTQEYLRRFSERHSADDVVRRLEGSRPLRFLTVGETIIDEYVYTTAIGKSSKEPMLAVQSLSAERFCGGILAVANHLAQVCDEVAMATFLGDTNPQEGLVRKGLAENVEPKFFYKRESPTIVKRRFIEQYFFTKLLVVYEMNDHLLDPADEKAFCAYLRKHAGDYDGVVVVDYGHGIMTDAAIDTVCEKARHLTVNTQSNAGNLGYHTISRYHRADYICMAENEFRLEARDRYKEIREIVADVHKKTRAGDIVVTRGKRGCLGWRKGEGFVEVPQVAGQVVDRMGAGDAFLSFTAPLALQKAPMEVLGLVGNAAGAQAVATVGNRSAVDRVGLLKHIETLLK